MQLFWVADSSKVADREQHALRTGDPCPSNGVRVLTMQASRASAAAHTEAGVLKSQQVSQAKVDDAAQEAGVLKTQQGSQAKANDAAQEACARYVALMHACNQKALQDKPPALPQPSRLGHAQSPLGVRKLAGEAPLQMMHVRHIINCIPLRMYMPASQIQSRPSCTPVIRRLCRTSSLLCHSPPNKAMASPLLA